VYIAPYFSTCVIVQVYAIGIAADSKTMLHEPVEIYGLQAQRYNDTLCVVMYAHKPTSSACTNHWPACVAMLALYLMKSGSNCYSLCAL
jgi:hypothetical protein